MENQNITVCPELTILDKTSDKNIFIYLLLLYFYYYCFFVFVFFVVVFFKKKIQSFMFHYSALLLQYFSFCKSVSLFHPFCLVDLFFGYLCVTFFIHFNCFNNTMVFNFAEIHLNSVTPLAHFSCSCH